MNDIMNLKRIISENLFNLKIELQSASKKKKQIIHTFYGGEFAFFQFLFHRVGAMFITHVNLFHLKQIMYYHLCVYTSPVLYK